MARAGKALKQVLETYGISQYQLAVAMGVDRSNVSRWVGEDRDPVAEAVFEIKQGLKSINPEAAKDFIRLYLGDDE
ncbi:MAG: helix-turn-helix domain-containing protein [Microcoleaceae cyanobacterium]